MISKLTKLIAIGLCLVSVQAFSFQYSYSSYDVERDARKLQRNAYRLAFILDRHHGKHWLARRARFLAHNARRVKHAARRGAPRYVIRSRFRQTTHAYWRLRRGLRRTGVAFDHPHTRHRVRRLKWSYRHLRHSVGYRYR